MLIVKIYTMVAIFILQILLTKDENYITYAAEYQIYIIFAEIDSKMQNGSSFLMSQAANSVHEGNTLSETLTSKNNSQIQMLTDNKSGTSNSNSYTYGKRKANG